MIYELELTKANRILLASAFHDVPRVDCSIPCVIEGQMGRAFVDDPAGPTIFHLVIGPFHYFAGPAVSPQAQAMMANFPPYNLLMPSTAGWAELARQQFGEALRTNVRHSFSSEALSAGHLQQLLAASTCPAQVAAIDEALAAQLSSGPDAYLGLADFDSPADFAARGVGYVALVEDRPVGIAYSSLVYSQGIEVSIYVAEAYRRQGIATALAANLLLACLQRRLHPNWDAANGESVKLAEKLGYQPTGSYEAYFHTIALSG